jgi:hypothetical protein
MCLRQHRYPQLREPAWLWRRYVDADLTTRAIAREVGFSEPAVRGALAAAGIRRSSSVLLLMCPRRPADPGVANSLVWAKQWFET